MTSSVMRPPIKKANQDLRQEMKDKGATMWQIADAAEVCEMTVIRWFRKELPEHQKTEIRRIIAEIAAKKAGE